MERLPEQIESERLVLRAWQTDDAPALDDAVTASVEHLRPWMAWIAFEPLTVAERAELITGWREDWEGGGDGIFGVFLDDVAIGGSGLHRRLGPGALEIGYWIHVDHVRRGYATEVAAALTGAALAVTGIDRVEIHHDKANVHSGRVAERLGYQKVAEVEDDIVAPAETGISCIWAYTE